MTQTNNTKRTILITAIIITLIVELVLMVLVYTKVGAERLPSQIGRLIVQLILIIWVLNSRSKTALFLLTAYHIFPVVSNLFSSKSNLQLQNVLIFYHLAVGLIIYFHDEIEQQLKSKK